MLCCLVFASKLPWVFVCISNCFNYVCCRCIYLLHLLVSKLLVTRATTQLLHKGLALQSTTFWNSEREREREREFGKSHYLLLNEIPLLSDGLYNLMFCNLCFWYWKRKKSAATSRKSILVSSHATVATSDPSIHRWICLAATTMSRCSCFWPLTTAHSPLQL